MKAFKLSCLTAALVAAFAAPAFAEKTPTTGSHYNLNLLGKTTCPGDDLKGGNRHTIFVLLNYSDADPDNTVETPDLFVNIDKRNKIFLAPGSDFQVTDGNACDGDGAAFTLPSDVATAWEVWVKELGKPGGTGDIRTCGVSDMGTPGDTSDDEVVCSTENVLLMRSTGKPNYRNVTSQLTTLQDVDIVKNGVVDSVDLNLFDPALYQYYWDYDNNGLRLVQLRFYPVSAQ